MLSHVMLSKVDLVDYAGVLIRTSSYDSNEELTDTLVNYDFTDLTLELTRNAGEPLHNWQIETVGMSEDYDPSTDDYFIQWEEEHPQYSAMIISKTSFDDGCAFVVVYY